MHRLRISLVAILAITLSSTMPSAASAQVGWAHLRTYLVGTNNSFEDRGVSRIFAQGSNGPVEIFSLEFTPGTHTIASVESLQGNCRATSDAVTFTITAGKWTEVSVPVTFKDCSLPINIVAYGGGTGHVIYTANGISGNHSIADCAVVAGGAASYEWVNYHGCQGPAAYGATVAVTATAGLGSTGSFVGTFKADTNLSDAFEYDFAPTSNSNSGAVSFKTDIGITAVGGSYGGFLSKSIFRIVNHGPNNAFHVRISPDDAFASDSGKYTNAKYMADGYCEIQSCSIDFLPAGDSTTMTIVYETFPAVANGTAPDNLPPFTASCTTVSITNEVSPDETGAADPNSSNNSAQCLHAGVVPVTVTLGGATPPSHTVAAGATNVPMIEFVLNPSSQQSVTGVTVQASGTGNEQADVTAVNLYVDKNANGAIDAGDSLVATGVFAANDGSVTLAVNPGLAITAPTALLVTYSFSLTVAERLGGAIVLAFLPLFFIPVVRKRKTVLAMLMVMLTSVAVVSCGGDSATGPKTGGGSVTFQSTLTGVTTSSGSVANLAVSGATITINK